MANTQVAQYLAYKGLAYTVSGSAYTLTDNSIGSKVIADLIRAAKEWNFKVALVSNDLVVSPA